ncbi:MAG: hypothetical protein ACLP8S_30835 [Solirubrobacteraceae bacterium]
MSGKHRRRRLPAAWASSAITAPAWRSQARAAVRASRRIGDALQDVQSRDDELIELVNRQAGMIERLETELEELRQQI